MGPVDLLFRCLSTYFNKIIPSDNADMSNEKGDIPSPKAYGIFFVSNGL